MIEDLDGLFGKTLEAKILTTIIPTCYKRPFKLSHLVNATGSTDMKVKRCLDKFIDFGIILQNGNQYLVRENSNMAKAFHSLIIMAYEDRLVKMASELLVDDGSDS
jgi:hypothetical protein